MHINNASLSVYEVTDKSTVASKNSTDSEPLSGRLHHHFFPNCFAGGTSTAFIITSR